MKIFIILTLCVALAAALQNTEFQAFKTRFRKFYRSALEEKFRQKTFLENLRMVQDHNALHQQGKTTFTLAINKFADLTSMEFAEKFNGYRQPVSHNPKNIYSSKAVNVPRSVDWRDYGYVTGVKNQGNCGSCWAFSAVGSLEGQHFKSTGKLVSLSEQNLVDCSGPQGNTGCNGGWMNSAFDYVIANNGLATEASYPYEASDGRCRYSAAEVGATASSYSNIARGDENDLHFACAENGPISVAIDASGSKFQLYENGVYDNPACSARILNHGVLVVGYGTENGDDYWLVKNSWGTSWGDKGYIKMSRNNNNQCGIATQASFPIV